MARAGCVCWRGLGFPKSGAVGDACWWDGRSWGAKVPAHSAGAELKANGSGQPGSLRQVASAQGQMALHYASVDTRSPQTWTWHEHTGEAPPGLPTHP